MDNSEQKSGNVSDIIKLLNKANETFVYEVYVPSLKKNVMFRQLNTSQQKRLIKAIIDSPAYNTEFIFTLKKIIEENCAEKVDINEFTILDKMIIAIKMRANSIDNMLELTFELPKEKDQKESTKIVRTINLNDLVELKLQTIAIEPITIVDENAIYTLNCSLPTIYDEYKLEDELRKSVTSIEIKNENELRTTIGEVFTNELVKYIKKITLKNDDKVIEIDLKSVDFGDRLQIIEKLPSHVTKKVIDYISTVQKEFDKILLFKDKINGKDFEQRLKIDASFFTRF